MPDRMDADAPPRLDDASLPAYLASAGLVEPGAECLIESPGEGNINFVRRVRTPDGRSRVVKQARGSLERFPEYSVSPERLLFEHRYGEIVRLYAAEEASLLPEILHFDPASHVLVMEDLGDAPTLERALLDGERPSAAFRRIGGYLAAVDRATRPRARELVARFSNDEMRELHGEHIFTLPFEPNEFGIDAALAATAERELGTARRERIAALRARYYGDAISLVHADVQGTNVILQGERPRLLDAEIAHIGDPAFDLGSLRAHLEVHAARGAAGLEPCIEALLDGHAKGGGAGDVRARSAGYAGVEMLRRTLGAARFGFVEGPAEATRVLARALVLLDADNPGHPVDRNL